MSPVRTLRHGLTLGGRGMLKIRHSPDQLLDVTLAPISFMLIFVFLFGQSVSGDWRAYLQYVLPGVVVQSMMFASLGTAVGLNADVRTGVYDRFRSLPIGRAAPLLGHVVGDVAKYLLALSIALGFGSALGFRFHGGIVRVVAGCVLIICFAFAMSWVATLLGLLARSPEAVQAFSFVLIFPLTFGSNVFVPTGQLPGWLQAWVKINPVSQLSTAMRALLLDQTVGRSAIYALAWTVGIIAVFAPLSVLAYRRRV
jgi:oleandomycin transport system permease protein